MSEPPPIPKSPADPQPSAVPHAPAGRNKPTQLARGFSCTSCGAPIKLLTGGVALSAACGNCGTAVDVTDPNLRVLAKWDAAMKRVQPVIPIGSRGVLKGISWQCIGFMQRREKASGWSWDEHLLFNPYHGFRWLVHDHGHWSYVTMIKDRPVRHSWGGASFRGLSFRRWAQAYVIVTAVLGEFYWLLEKDETVAAIDYISPPFMLSQECYPGGSELIFSYGEYIERSEVGYAFNLSSLPWPQDIGATQPNPWKQRSRTAWRWALFALLIMLAEQFGVLSLSSSKPALRDNFAYVEQQGKTSYASAPFELGGFTRGVTVKTESMINGGSLDLRMRLVNEDTQASIPIGQTIARFSGWTADQASAESSLSNVPPGRYRLVVEPSNFTSTDPESPANSFATFSLGGTPAGMAPPVPLTFEVARKAGWSPFTLCSFFLLVPAVLVGFMSLSYEGRRWKNSDEGGSSASDDD